jgi:hypothetical protein
VAESEYATSGLRLSQKWYLGPVVCRACTVESSCFGNERRATLAYLWYLWRLFARKVYARALCQRSTGLYSGPQPRSHQCNCPFTNCNPRPILGAYNPATMGNQQWFGAVVSFVCPDCEISSLEKVAVKTGQPDREAIEYALGQRRLACHICKQAPNPNVLLHFDVHPCTEEDLKNRGFRFRDSQD